MPSQVINGVGKAGFRPATSSVATVDTDAQTFLTAASITATTQVNAVNELVKDLKSAGLWTKMKAVYPFVGGTATSHKWNLKDPRDTNDAYRLVFYGGWTHSSTGVLPNGTDAYSNTFLNPSLVMTSTDSHASVYSRTSTFDGSAERHFFGANSLRMYHFRYTAYARLGGATDIPNSVQTNTAGNSSGFFMSNRSSSTIYLYKNGTAIEGSGSASGGFDNVNIYLGAWNYNNSVNGRSNKEMSLVSFGNSLTSDELDAYYNIVEKFQFSLGRSINTTLPYYYNNSYSIETNLFLSRAGITDSTQRSAINTLVNTLKTANIWTKMKAIYPMVGGTSNSHKINLVNRNFNLTFYGGWVHSSTGALPNGSTAYADTGLSPVPTLTPAYYNAISSVHLSYYSRTDTNVGGEMGTYYIMSTHSYLGLYSRTSNYSYYPASVETSTNNLSNVSVANADGRGFYMTNRTSTTSQSGFKNSTKVLNISLSSAGYSQQSSGNNSLFIGAVRHQTRPDLVVATRSNKECAFSSIGEGLTDAEATIFYNAVQAFQTTLNRQV